MNRDKIISFFAGTKQPEAEFIPKERVDGVLAKIDFYKKLGFEKSLKQYSVDYILLDKDDLDYGFLVDKFREMPFLSLVAEIENSLIFKAAE